MRSKLVLSVSTFATVISLGVGAAAWAQEDGDDSAKRLDVVNVQALKREADIQDVPLSVTAVTGDAIDEAGIADIEDLGFLVPNFQFNTSTAVSNARINIRGVSSVGDSGIEPSVGVFINGAYSPRPGAVLGNLFDVQQIEVLRGPQGTLFGRNTPVGAMLITTRPARDEFGGSIKASAGGIGDEFGSYGLEGHVTGQIAQGLAGRFAFNFDERVAFIENTFDGEDEGERQDFGVRGTLSWDTATNVDATLIVDYQSVDHTGNNIEIKSGTETDTFLDRVEALYGVRPDVEDTFDQRINQNHVTEGENETWGATLTVNIDAPGDHTITSITSYRDYEDFQFNDSVRLPLEVLLRRRTAKTDNFAQELRIASPGGQRLEYIAGVYYYDENYTIDTAFDVTSDWCNITLANNPRTRGLVAGCNAEPFEDVAFQNFGQELTSYAVFGQATYYFADNFSATGGLRWTRDDKEDGFFTRESTGSALAGNIPVPISDQDLSVSGESVTWLANVRYYPVENVMLFATAGTGFKSGGINSEPGPDAQERIFDEENTETYELGIKSEIFDGRVIANATLYRTDVDDFQERQFQDDGFIVTNAGSLRQQGVELDVRAKPVDQWDVVIGASYLDSEFTDFENAPALPGGSPQDLTGQTRQDSPEWQYSISSKWTDDLPGTNLDWSVRGEYQFVDDQFLDASLTPQSLQEAYGIANFRAALSSDDSGWTLAGFVRNAFDEGYCVRTFIQTLGGNFGAVDRANNTAVQRCVVGRPRSYGVELTARF